MNQWDELVCIFGHFPSEVRKKVLEGVKNTVKPGGYFSNRSIFYSPNSV